MSDRYESTGDYRDPTAPIRRSQAPAYRSQFLLDCPYAASQFDKGLVHLR
jgi:hypothetical protein